LRGVDCSTPRLALCHGFTDWSRKTDWRRLWGVLGLQLEILNFLCKSMNHGKRNGNKLCRVLVYR
jgi:hypothetical protein